MSEKYLPLFRKYRPQSFKDVVGQESLVKALSNAIELNKIANAYLFSGPRGTGKTSCARIFAKSLNCIEGPTLTPCQKCPSCLDITNASGLDVIEIDAATNRGIDDAKELIAQVQYAPMNGKYKIFIIDEVHMLSNEAFNALLKTFEEPPQNVIFILATTEPHKVIETIVSRCQRFDLRRITTDDITKRLREISDLESIKITDDALYTIAKNVSGGLRDSLALLDQVSILGAKEEITKEVIENLLGKMTFDVSSAFLEKILSKDTKGAILYIDEIYNKGLEPKNFCENFIEFLRNIIFALSSDDEKNTLKFTNFNICDIEKIRNLNLDSSLIFRILNKVIEYYKEIKYATNPYLWAELMIIGLCNIDNTLINNKENQNTQTAQKTQVAGASFYNAKSPADAHKMEPGETGSLEKPVTETQSFVKETLIDINIPENNPVKEERKSNEPEHLMEYKENLYEAKEKKTVDNKALESSKEPESIPSLPKVPGVDDVPAQSVSENKVNISKDILNKPNEAENNSLKEGIEEANPVSLWVSVLNAIELIPAKYFFSSRKLIGIKNKKITLGFVNDKLIEQAKSDSKYKHLDKAIKNVLGADYTVEFVIMTPDMKPIDIKLTSKVQSPKPVQTFKPVSYETKPALDVQNPTSSNYEPSKEDIEKEVLMDMNLPAENTPYKNTSYEKTHNEENEDDTQHTASNPAMAHYGKKTLEMIETFNGKVID